MHVARRDLLEAKPRAEILGLVVDAAARQRGVGAALVDAAEQWARDHGFDELIVRSNVARPAAPPATRIVLVTTAAGWGGAEAHTLHLARVLRTAGARVILIEVGTNWYARHAGADGLELRAIDADASSFRWRRLLRAVEADIVVLVKGGFGSRVPALDLAMLGSGRRFVAIEHSVPAPPPVRTSRRHLGGLVPGLGLWYHRTVMELRLHRWVFDAVITPAASVARCLVEEYGYSGTRITVAPNGVDVHRFHHDPAARDAARRRWEIPPGAVVVGTVARLVHEKALDRLVRAFAGVVTAVPDLDPRLVIAGDGPERESLAALAQSLSLGARVVWPGRTEHPEGEYPGFDVFAMTSENESTPYALLEAMACERCPVVMGVADVGVVVTDGVTGFVTDQNVATYQRALQRVLRMKPEERDALGRLARAWVVTHADHRSAMRAVAVAVAPGLSIAPVP